MFLYIDCIGGISGDMFLGALLDLGVPRKVVTESIASLGIGGWKLSIGRESRSVIKGTRLKVKVSGKQSPRRWVDIKIMLKDSGLSPGVRRRALNIFGALALAESEIHGEQINSVHFHEVGAIDGIVDIVGAAAALEWLGVKESVCSPIPLGRGTTTCAHGIIPLPAPATVLLLKGIESFGVDIEGETCTPTGAAILRTTVKHSGIMPSMTIKNVGHGIGAADWPERPNVLRLIHGEVTQSTAADEVVSIEANVDDMFAQDFEPMMEAAFDAGALDVTLMNMQMKKNRPGVLIRALAHPGSAGNVINSLLRHSSTLGVRWHRAKRRMLSRTEIIVKTPFGKIRAKRSELPGGGARETPEYDDLRNAARKAGVPIAEVRRAFWAAVK